MTGILDRQLDLVLCCERDRFLSVGSSVDFDGVERDSTLIACIARDLRLVRGEGVEPAIASARF